MTGCFESREAGEVMSEKVRANSGPGMNQIEFADDGRWYSSCRRIQRSLPRTWGSYQTFGVNKIRGRFHRSFSNLVVWVSG